MINKINFRNIMQYAQNVSNVSNIFIFILYGSRQFFHISNISNLLWHMQSLNLSVLNM